MRESKLKEYQRFRFTLLAPLAIIGISLWLLIGCVYIPTPTSLHLTGSTKDFRSMVGVPGSQKPIVARRISRAAVWAVLGPPPFASDNRRRLMYVIHERSGILIMPLCFTIRSNSDQAIGLVLTFDETGMLQDWEQLDAHNGVYLGTEFATAESVLWSKANGRPSTGRIAATRSSETPTSGSYSGPWQLKSTSGRSFGHRHD